LGQIGVNMPAIAMLLINTLAPLFIEKAARAIMTPEAKKEVVVAAVKAIPTSKTMWFAFILALLGLIEQYQELFTALIGANRMGTVLLVISAISAVLRIFTTESLPDKGNK
jgi:hypothetical protein